MAKRRGDHSRLLGFASQLVTVRQVGTWTRRSPELRAGGYEVRDEDAARLSPFGRHHVNLLGRYSFLLTAELGDGLRPLRDPDAADTDDETEEE